MELAQRAYLGRGLTPCANFIRLDTSSWFGSDRARPEYRRRRRHPAEATGVAVVGASASVAAATTEVATAAATVAATAATAATAAAAAPAAVAASKAAATAAVATLAGPELGSGGGGS
eukprot:scaffold121325_cov44-Phaeocystis_antarctica.AAC.1